MFINEYAIKDIFDTYEEKLINATITTFEIETIKTIFMNIMDLRLELFYTIKDCLKKDINKDFYDEPLWPIKSQRYNQISTSTDVFCPISVFIKKSFDHFDTNKRLVDFLEIYEEFVNSCSGQINCNLVYLNKNNIKFISNATYVGKKGNEAKTKHLNVYEASTIYLLQERLFESTNAILGFKNCDNTLKFHKEKIEKKTLEFKSHLTQFNALKQEHSDKNPEAINFYEKCTEELSCSGYPIRATPLLECAKSSGFSQATMYVMPAAENTSLYSPRAICEREIGTSMGLVIGIPVAILALSTLIGCFFCFRKNK